ncbi:MAG TPA: 16S rRNA (cytidine(1402)-2'-O)-methyltransferase [Prolixibacteraceae bacterium]|nr:16S rRNA (cytidine(1402)-2'-O)-methyltransferase [Prolixibacteraceae bacterium]
MGKLFLVPTPIGNLEDMTFRAVRILKEVDVILAEDTRTSARLLSHYEIKNRLLSHHKFNEHKTVEMIAAQIEEGKNVALISDAGTPGISDPGFLLVKTCLEKDIEVECLPGATALIPALVNSGFPTDRFTFEGFLPQKKGRHKKIKELMTEPRTMIFYESPYRLMKTLEQFAEFLGPDRRASVSRELSKLFEENKRGTLAELIEHFGSKAIKGEIVIVLEGYKETSTEETEEE